MAETDFVDSDPFGPILAAVVDESPAPAAAPLPQEMERVRAPHFDLPFRLGAAGAAVNEQGSLEDIADCVTMIFMVPIGWREQTPGFGTPDFAFKQAPIGASEIAMAVSEQEPRAVLVVTEQLDRSDELITLINVGVGRLQGTEAS